MLQKDWITMEDAATAIGCTRGYVRQLLRANVLEGKKLTERMWVVKKTTVEKFAKTPKKTGRPRNPEKSSEPA